MAANPQYSRKLQKRIFENVVLWMEGKKTVYQVAKEAKCDHRTAKKWLHIFAAEINKQKGIVEETIQKIEGTRKDVPLWQKIKQQIVMRILSAGPS